MHGNYTAPPQSRIFMSSALALYSTMYKLLANTSVQYYMPTINTTVLTLISNLEPLVTNFAL